MIKIIFEYFVCIINILIIQTKINECNNDIIDIHCIDRFKKKFNMII